MQIQKSIAKFNIRTYFLVDFIGALVSMFFLGVILPIYQSYIGMPLKILYLLAGIPFFFFMFSLYAYLKAGKNSSTLLRIIAVLNTLYCCLTLALLVYYRGDVTIFGYIYFIVEILIVLSLAFAEYKRSFINQAI